MAPRPNRTITVFERGQTNMDFAIGIGIFLLAIAFVFTFVPSIITPFDSGVGGAENAQADRMAATIMHETADNHEIDMVDLNAFLATESNRVNNLGIRFSSAEPFDRVSVTLNELDGSTVNTWGENYQDGQVASSAARIVTNNNPGECDPACRLIVRVW